MPILSPEAAPVPAPDSRLVPSRLNACLRSYLTEQRVQRIERVLADRLLSVTVVLERPYDPHNGAAVLRSCEAFGVLNVHVITGPNGFSFSRKVTQSAHKWLNVYLHESTRACLTLIQGWGFECWAAAPPELGSSDRGALVAAEHPVALVFGNEHSGLSDEALICCDQRFHLPMHGFSESLNLSVSTALAVREVTSRRRRRLGRTGDLPPRALAQLRTAYYVNSVRRADALVLRHLRRIEEAE